MQYQSTTIPKAAQEAAEPRKPPRLDRGYVPPAWFRVGRILVDADRLPRRPVREVLR